MKNDTQKSGVAVAIVTSMSLSTAECRLPAISFRVKITWKIDNTLGGKLRPDCFIDRLVAKIISNGVIQRRVPADLQRMIIFPQTLP